MSLEPTVVCLPDELDFDLDLRLLAETFLSNCLAVVIGCWDGPVRFGLSIVHFYSWFNMVEPLPLLAASYWADELDMSSLGDLIVAFKFCWRIFYCCVKPEIVF